ncbi:Wzz/FepE/Etk N-terminal domain-containing protein [Nonomuraea sediminis]|uniref:Wzz/FepE/Etk N-terminal domain-containing protein n=1 Tax=Nonomuraea sediminis TaxID=2835864 RepID=UPI001BDC52F9|nr:Wzz/FepE/Etk N-terminal domain-containing protein [Nonomuraea sediminis]
MVELDEVAARLIRRYWPIILLCALLPMLAIGYYARSQPPTYTASATLVIASKVPQAAGEAAGVAGQAQAFATSPDVLRSAMQSAGVSRDLTELAKNVTLTGLGSSPLASLEVTDRDPDAAKALAAALAVQVTGQIDQSRVSGLRTVLHDVTQRISDLTSQLAKAQKAVLGAPKNADLIQKRDDIQRSLTDQKALRANVVDQAALAGQSRVVSWPARPPQADSQRLLQMLVVALVGGLVLGVMVASAMETVRPTVPGVRRVSRRLGVPLLGCARGRHAAIEPLVRKLRLAARKAGVHTVVLVGSGGSVAPEVMTAMNRALTVPPAKEPTPESGHDETTPVPRKTNASGGVATALAAKKVVMTEDTSPIPAILPAVKLVSLEDLPQEQELEGVGLVLVSKQVTRLANLYVINDLVEASGWPLLGVVADYAPRLRLKRR